MNNLTDKQQDVMGTINKFVQDEGHIPTYEEIGEEVGLSKSGVRNHISALIKKGYLHKQERGYDISDYYFYKATHGR